jgi:hypothetical protein
VTQVLSPASPALSNPEMLQIITGLHRQIETAKLAGAYANVAVDVLFPGLLVTSVLDVNSVVVSVVNEFGTFVIAAGSLTDLATYALDNSNTGVDLPDYLRVARTSQAVSTTGALTVDSTNVITGPQASAATTISGLNVTVAGATFLYPVQVLAGDVLELNDVNNAGILRRFRVSTNAAANTVVTVESLNPDGVGALANGTHTNIRVFRPVYNFTDTAALFFSNRTRPVDDGLPSGSKLYPQPSDTLSNPATFTGLRAFIKFAPTVGSPATWNITTWPSQTAVTLNSKPITSVSSGPPMVNTTGIRYTVVTEEPAIGRIPGASAEVLLTYSALRTDLVGKLVFFQGITGDQGATAVLGPDHPDNPLGFAAHRAAAINTDTKIGATAVLSDDPSGHGTAIETLATSSEAYYITPISGRTDVAALYQAHVVLQSEPESRRERVAAVHVNIPERTIVADYGDPGTVTVTSSPNTITIPGATFLSQGVHPGQLVELEDAGHSSTVRQFYITYVITNTQVEILSRNPDGVGNLATGAHTAVKIVTANFTAEDKKNALVATATGIAERRVALVEPDHAVFTVNAVDYTLDGSYLATSICAMYSIHDPGTPLSNTDVPGVKSVSNSDDVFNESQLQELVSAGVMIVVQPNKLAAPYIRHQVSTDTSDAKKQEWSFTHNVDSFARALRKNINPILGKNNLTEEFVRKLEVIVHSTTAFFVEQKRFTNPQIADVGISSTVPNALAVAMSADFPGVANNVDIVLTV